MRFFGRATHLHRVWDSDVINAQKFSYSELTQILMNKITDDDIQKWQTADPYIFHKTEVLTVILRCLMGLNLNWVKSYGLKCSLRHRASLGIERMAKLDYQMDDMRLLFENDLRLISQS